METVTVIIIGSVALATMLPLLALWIAYRRNPVVATIRQASQNLKKVEGYVSQVQGALEDAIFDLKKQAREFVEAQRNTRLMEIPLEGLKDAGAANVRWSALRHAGLTRLAQVLRLDERRLMSIQGVGRATAVRVMHAARSLAAKVLAEPPSLPSADLKEPHAEKLAAGTVHLLHARDLLEGVPEQLNADVGKFRQRFREIRQHASLGNWLIRGAAFAKDAEIKGEVQVLLGETQELLESDAVRSTRDRLTFLSGEMRRPYSIDRLKEEFRDRYADATALIESCAFGKGQISTQTARKRTLGGLPTEVAERAEKVGLQTQGMRVTLR